MTRVSTKLFAVWITLVFSCLHVFAAANGSASGTVTDPSAAVIAGATVTLTNTALKSEYTTLTNGQRSYSFPALPVGHYELTIEAAGFKTQKRADVVVNTDAALTLGAVLAVPTENSTLLKKCKRQARGNEIGWALRLR